MSNDTILMVNASGGDIDEDVVDGEIDDLNNGGISQVIMAKLIAMLVLCLASVIFGMLPFKLAQIFKWENNGGGGDRNRERNSGENGNHLSGQDDRRSRIIISALLAFGGGVLLSTTFLHLLPEVKETIDHLQEQHLLMEFPFHFAEFLMCMGFFTMYFVEELVHIYLHKEDKKYTLRQQMSNGNANEQNGCDPDDPNTINGSNNDENAFRRGISIRHSSILNRKKQLNNIKLINDNQNNSLTSNFNDSSKIDLLQSSDNIDSNCQKSLTISPQPTTSTSVQSLESCTGQQLSIIDTINCSSTDNNNVLSTEIPAGSHHHHGHSHLPKMRPNEDLLITSIRGLLIVLALSIHELFEGLAVGLEGSANDVWYMFAAVASHKFVLAFCVGVELIFARTKLYIALCYVLSFAVVSPLGIGIGMLISNASEDITATSGIPSVILQGFACGTLLYVVFFEILQKGRSGLVQFVGVLIGFFVMFGLKFLTGGHSHGGSNDDHDDHHDHDHDH